MSVVKAEAGLQNPESPLLILGDGFGVVGHKHVVRSFQGPEDQSVDWVFLHILQKSCYIYRSVTHHKNHQQR